jgi:hypothetical protein
MVATSQPSGTTLQTFSLMLRPIRPRPGVLLRPALLATILFALCAHTAVAQTTPSRADLPRFLFDPAYYSARANEKKAVMDGNDIAFTFFNTGLLGGLGEVRANWPKGVPETYIGDVLPIIAVEFPVRLPSGRDTMLVNTITVRGPRAGIEAEGPPGQSSVFWGFEPKPGFAADQFREPGCVRPGGDNVNDRPAISTDPCTWPAFWPDQPDWIDPATGRADWNGYFGRGVFNADYETYFWVDDTNDGEPRHLAQQVGGTFVADTTRPNLVSNGLAMKVRGMAWSNFLAKDTQFWLYEVTNTSTTTYKRVAVGYTAGVCVGDDAQSNYVACQRDIAFFDQGNRMVYAWDATGRSVDGQRPTGYVGFGLMETPGDPYNGIDDDGDGDPFTEQGRDLEGRPFVNPPELAGENNVFTARDFEPRTLAVGDPVIVIDYDTFERSIHYLGTDPIVVQTPRGTLTAAPGMTVQERQISVQGYLQTQVVTERNGVDENFNGLIDEDINLHYVRRFQQLDGSVATLPALRYKDWMGFARALVTERAPNGAVLGTREPTRADSMRYGLLNPRIDEVRLDPTDVTQSDQVGLTSFYYFTPPGALRMNQDRDLWRAMTPGFFTTNDELDHLQGRGGTDGNFIFGSGYFLVPPGRTLHFSLAFVFGQDLEAITLNTRTVQEIYNRNYQFTQPPIRPTLRAVPGDGQVTLYWDSASLDSYDSVLGYHFEGFRIFKSTDPYFRTIQYVTDVRGNPAIPVPTWQYDLANGVRGIYTSSDPRTRGVPFPLGDDTGLRFSVVDTDVRNGQRYYYAITAYNAGSEDFFPAENNFAISVREDGSVVTGANVVEVIPNASAAGYRAGALHDEGVRHVRGGADGGVIPEILDARMIPDNAYYSVTFDGNDLARADSFYVHGSGGALLASGPIARAESYVFDGIRLHMNNVVPRLKGPGQYVQGGTGKLNLQAGLATLSLSGWSVTGTPVGYDYEITFSDEYIGHSIGGFRIGEGRNAPLAVAMPTNFSIRNTTLDEPAKYAVFNMPDGIFRRGAGIFIYEQLDPASEVLTPVYLVVVASGATGANPGTGDVFLIESFKPFSVRDQFVLEARPAEVVADAARDALDQIRVVPNPYVAAAGWERPLPPTTSAGRGERRIDFIRLPVDARVRIYTIRGAMLWEGHYEGDGSDGTLSWDLRSREGLDVAYGVYFWHVDSPVGQRTGKLALIK